LRTTPKLLETKAQFEQVKGAMAGVELDVEYSCGVMDAVIGLQQFATLRELTDKTSDLLQRLLLLSTENNAADGGGSGAATRASLPTLAGAPRATHQPRRSHQQLSSTTSTSTSTSTSIDTDTAISAATSVDTIYNVSESDTK
jgi:hypothetical protein